MCDDYTASVDQSSSQVKVRLKSEAKEPGKKCVLMAERMDKKVTLDEPLDGRKVVDASNGEALPAK
ncbi:hypothetical protein NKH77_14555 [Streptomyces sp. M19]